MSNAAIVIENVGKRYKLGPRARGDGTFYEALIDWCAAPLRRL